MSALQLSNSNQVKQALTAVYKDTQERPSQVVVRGRGRGKAKAPVKKFAEALSYAITVLESVVASKTKELRYRIGSYEDTAKQNLCTCVFSSQPDLMCYVCKQNKRKHTIPHSVTLPRHANGKIGVRLTGVWVLVLSEIKSGFPASGFPALERFLEHRISHVNKVPVAGKAQTSRELEKATDEVEFTFYPKYMNIVESQQQSEQQHAGGRPRSLPIGPTEEERRPVVPAKRASPVPTPNAPTAPPTTLYSKSHPVIQSSRHKVADETPIDAVKRRLKEGYHETLLLENLAKVDEASFPAVFRLITEERQRSYLSANDDTRGVPPAGVFKKEEIRAFYPSLVTGVSTAALPTNMKQIATLLENFMSDPRMDVFNVIVDEELHGAPRYYELVHQPVDFGTILGRVRNHLYSTAKEVKADCNLVWSNCKLYNPEPHWLYATSDTLAKELNEMWRKAKVDTLSGSRPFFDSDEDDLLPGKQLPKLKARLANQVLYSSGHAGIVEKLSDMYTIVGVPVDRDTSLVDLHIVLTPALCTESKIKSLVSALDKGQESTSRRLKLSRKEK